MVDDKGPEMMPAEPPNQLQEFAAGSAAGQQEAAHAVEEREHGSAVGGSTLQGKEETAAAEGDPEKGAAPAQKVKNKWCVSFAAHHRRHESL